jgi:hypothetical protein
VPTYHQEVLYPDVAQVQHEGLQSFGSGRLIGRNLILTARHVVIAKNATAPMRDGWKIRLFGAKLNDGCDWKWRDAEVIWTGKRGLDLALLAVRPKDGTPDMRPRLRLRVAKFKRVTDHSVRGIGFPLGARMNNERQLVTPAGRLIDQARETLTWGIDQSYIPEAPDKDWPGFSGSAVLLAETDDESVIWVYGVATQVPTRFKRQLDVARLESAMEYTDFCDALRAAEVSPEPAVDPTEYAGLRDLYIRPDGIFRRVNIDRFEGRIELRAKVDGFLKELNQGYIIVEAQAGLGKTTFLAHLVKERGYIHHFIPRASTREDMLAGVESIAAQLISVWDLGVYRDQGALRGAARRSDFLETLLDQAAKRRDEKCPGKPIVLVIDALDEAWAATGQNVLGLPPKLPKGVFVLASQRPVRVQLLAGDKRSIKLLANSEENERDMRTYLKAAGRRLGLGSYQSGNQPTINDFVSILSKKSRGLWIYLHYVLEQIESRDRPLIDLNALPDGLWSYYADFWRRERERAGEQWLDTYSPLLGTLGAMRENVTAVGLKRLSGVSLSPEAIERLLRGRWLPFLDAQDSEGGRYELYHASLHDFLGGKINREDVASDDASLADELQEATRCAHSRLADRYFDEWGGLSAGLPGLLEPSRRDADNGYGLRHVAAHLEMAERDQDLHSLLQLEYPYFARVSRNREPPLSWADRLLRRGAIETVTRYHLTWQAAHESVGDIQGFLDDLYRAWRLADLARIMREGLADVAQDVESV